MDRKWRTNRAAIFTVVPYAEYCSRILQRTAEYDLATPSDLYAVYTVLHIESKTSELHWSESGGFYYFLATWSQAPEPDQIIVPVGSACTSLTPALLQRFFSIRGVAAQQLLLALVDGNGMVSRTCLFNYIQAPLEGPGTADLDLLDD
ncbi:hypothetical protein F751_4488 [Auxenochlorella protothecoides]|uniref:Uncharacterized protein n=1 Tax=Auxenochlorella protothecoides TaxID=3075 RepID=A0A087SNB4_AUXPR|nr:hypothetical protein F751_4488 [Auxenochlorella protothecoides]KFM27218.1 hypothetical protein F751_4488 [Auxenochlorella protothecoides]